MNDLTRGDAYLRNAWKGPIAEGVVEDLCRQWLAVPLSPITDPEEQRTRGDFRTPSGLTIEVKGQKIDPRAYGGLNFVGVFEEDRKRRPYLREGFSRTARALGIDEAELAAFRWSSKTAKGVVGRPSHVDAAICSVAGSAWTIYARNAPPEPTFVYVYESPALIRSVLDAMRAHELELGAGGSNQDTYGVKVPVPAIVFARESGVWRDWTKDATSARPELVRRMLGTARPTP